MGKNGKSLSKETQIEKRVEKVFKKRAEILQNFGLSARVPKLSHFVVATKR